MLEIFAVGSFWFWMLILAEFSLLLVFTEYENGIAATISIAAFLAALQFLGGVPVFQFILAKPWLLAIFIAPYLAIALGWLTFMWRRFCNKKYAEHEEMLADFVEKHGLPEGTKDLPMQYRPEWVRLVEATRDYTTKQTIADTPKIRHHKARAGRWFLLWPFSMALFFFKDMALEVWNHVYTGVAKFLQKVADAIFSKPHIKGNLELPPKEDGSEQQRNAG